MAKSTKKKSSKPAAKAKSKAVAKSSRAKTAAKKTAAAKKVASARKSSAAKAKLAPKKAAPKPKTAVKAKPVAKAKPAPRRAAAPRPVPPPPAISNAIAPPPVVEPPTPGAPAGETSTPAAPAESGGSSDEEPRRSRIREAVASFATRGQFRDAVRQLLVAGFAATDLSVLASHESLETIGGVPGYRAAPGQSFLAGLTDEVSFLAPLQIAGFSALSGGPLAGAFAAAVTAGLGTVALEELVDRFVANRRGRNFGKALAAGGVLLWVRVADAASGREALRILQACAGHDAHIVTRAPPAD